jgi:pyruvate-formate lyase-activating enzyme
MSAARPLVLVDCGRFTPDAAQGALWQRSSFVARVESLGDRVLCWAPGKPADLPWPSLRTPEALSEALADRGAGALIVVEPGQLFLDVPLALAGLEAFDPAHHDSFTQWEHCRLPVGVGVRALAARTWFELGADSPSAAFDALRAAPAGRSFSYEVRRRVSYADSRLDSRDGDALRGLLEDHEPLSWDLAGFLELSRKAAANGLDYQPEQQADRVDERRMPAPYGFESDACASFPTYVMFDITNVCNARCVHCPQSLRDGDGALPDFLRDREHQSLAVFQRVIDECSEQQVNFVRITADGEPLVHPHLFEMLEYARDRGVGPVGLTTNGSLLTEARALRLLDSGVGVVDFSLDAATAETFDRVRVGLDFEKTWTNVLRFIELARARDAPVKIMVSFVKQSANADEIGAFRAYWAPLVDEVVVREMISNVGLNDPSESLWPGWDARWPCAHFFRRVVINHRGQLKACPIDWEQRTVNQAVTEASLFEQWHGDFYWHHRMQHLNDAIETESACKTCPDWAGTPWDMGYEKIIERLVEPAEVI